MIPVGKHQALGHLYLCIFCLCVCSMGVASCPAPVVPQLADASSPHQAAAVLSDPISLNQAVYTLSVGPLLQHIRNIQHIQKLEYWNHIEVLVLSGSLLFRQPIIYYMGCNS